jgi:arylsulfatase A-like enzyme
VKGLGGENPARPVLLTRVPVARGLALAALTCALLTGARSALGLALVSEPKARPNILFLFADDQRPDTIAALGNEFIKTPSLDRLVAEGTSFLNNHCMGSNSGAVCLPSRAMVMSGRSLHRVKSDLAQVVTLGEALGKGGYRTFGTGKWHNGSGSFARSFDEGKSVFFGGMSDHNGVPLQDLKDDGSGFTDKRTGQGHSTDIFADAAVKFLEGYGASDRDQPFFAYVAFTAPHDPRDPPVRWREHYAANLPPLPANFLPQHTWAFDTGTLVVRDEVLAGWPRDPLVVGEQLGEYYGLISHVDQQVGRILDTLDRLELDENTLVIYSADHGLAVGSHGLLGKQNLYEHSMGCPLILRGPGIPMGEVREALTYLFDIYPTLCEVATVPVGEKVEGRSFLALAKGDGLPTRDSLFTVYQRSQLAVRDGRWKLIRFPKIDVTLLFDLEADPLETHDLAASPEYAPTLERMRALLLARQAELADKTPWTADELGPKQVDLSGRSRKPDRHQPEWIKKKYF